MIDQSMMVALWLSQCNATPRNTLEYNTFYYNNIVMIDQSMMVALWLSQCNAIKCNTLECNTFYYNCIALIDQSMMVALWLSQYHTMQYNPNIIQCSRTESRVSLKIKKIFILRPDHTTPTAPMYEDCRVQNTRCGTLSLKSDTEQHTF